jgi:uncharacterized membrane protein (UPF0182 family)
MKSPHGSPRKASPSRRNSVTARRWLFVALAGVAALLVAGRALAGVYAEWTWYAAMGALPLFKSRLAHEAAFRSGALIAGFMLAFGNLYTVRASIVSLALPRRIGNIEFGEVVEGRYLTLAVFVASIVIAVILAVPDVDWTTFALARIGEPFGETDPYLDRTFSTYIYQLPFERSLYLWTVVAVVLLAILVVTLYAVTPSLRLERGKLYVSAYVRRHFAALAGIALALVAWSYRLETLSLLAHGSGVGGAFSAFDHRVAVPLLTGLSLGSLVASVVVFWAGWHGYHRVTFVIVSVMILAGPGARTMLPLLARATTDAEEARRQERPYLTTRTLFTRRAFGIDEIVNADSAHIAPLANGELTAGVSSWDPAALMRTADVERRSLVTAGFSWAAASGGLTATIVQHGTDATTAWPASTIDATTADERGRALPRVAERPSMTDDAIPSVLIGDGLPAYAIVADSAGRLASPEFGTWWERIGQSWHLQNPRLLAGEPPSPRPRIVFHREVRERLQAIAPFFTIGPTIHALVRGDSLYWVAELFSTTNDYPLSEPQLFAGESRHYVRHAATAFVQAQTGRIFLVADAHPDAIARTWMHRFPWLFLARGTLPNGLDAVRPPAVDWASVQGAALARTGFATDTMPPRALARADDADADVAGGAPTFFVAGPNGALGWSVGVLNGNAHPIGALVARGGAEPRTEWHATSALGLRWDQLLERLQHTADSAGIGHQRRQSRRGRVQVLPVGGSLAFVQSFYEWPGDGAPTLTGVVLLQNGVTRTAPTVAELLGAGRSSKAAGTEALRGRVTILYDQMAAAMRRGDWTAFGEAYAALGKLLRSAP